MHIRGLEDYIIHVITSFYKPEYIDPQGRSYSKAPPPPPQFLKNYFILCISIKNFKYLATKIEVGPPKCLS